MPPVDDQPVDLGANPVEVDPAIYGDETNRHVDNPFRKCSVHHFLAGRLLSNEDGPVEVHAGPNTNWEGAAQPALNWLLE